VTIELTGGVWTNWVGNQSFAPAATDSASNAEEVQQAVARAVEAGRTIRTVGTGHSFTPIIDADVLLDTSPMRGVIGVDPEQLTVIAGPKTTIGDFGDPLWEVGLALANQGDIDTQAIAGAIATATHGSGLRQPNFSAALAGARMVDGMGNVVVVSPDENPDVLAALQASMGLLGIMTEVTLRVVPAYDLHARVDIMKYHEVMESFESDIEEFRHFGLFWMPTDASAELYNLHDAGADDCVVKRYREVEVGTRVADLQPNERIDRSYRVYPMIYDPNFHEVEYFLPIEQAREIMDRMRALMLEWLPLSLYPLEIRVVAADDAWLSPNYERDNLVVSISGEPGTDYWPYLRACDDLFAEYGGRPHWGKIHFMTAERIAGLFPRYEDFLEVRRRFDPRGTFLNPHLRALFE
jgi:FAD/FMN-containing dehydrogenase